MNEEKMVTLTIDGRQISVPKGTTVYQAAVKLGIEIPIFCYFDRLPPFGACRVCMVEVEKMAKPQTSCTLEATDGMVVKTQSTMAEEGRKAILEYLLINHPLDCPICDRGGECPLQDNTIKYGPGMSRFFENKKRFKKPLQLSPVLMLDRERCIICARCVRFGNELAGDHALQFVERGYRSEVGTPKGEPAESKFIGNTIMICPVGALTSKVYRFRARPWDNDMTESTCTLCPVGCSMIFDSRDGEIMRTRSRENKEVNDVWMCDKGWFGYQFLTHPDRLKTPLIRKGDKLLEASWEEALDLIAAKLQEFKRDGKLAAFGGNVLTVEENYLFQKMMRSCAGVDHLDHRIGMPIFDGMTSGMEMTIGECETVDYAVLVGLDITEEFPVIWLRLRQAINRGAKVLFLGHYAPEIAPYLSEVLVHTPGQEISQLKELAKNLDSSKKGALFVGSQYLSHLDRTAILNELKQIKQSNPNLSLNLMEGRNNSMGAAYAGMRPDFGPTGEQLPNHGLNVTQCLEEAGRNGWDFLYIAGANPENYYSSNLWHTARKKLKFLVVQDLFLTETAQDADVVLPTRAFAEKTGSFINIERRVQKLNPASAVDNLLSDGDIFKSIANRLNVSLEIDEKFLQTLRNNQRIQLPFIVGKKKDHIKNEENKGLKASFSHSLFDTGVRMQHNMQLKQMVKEPYVRIHPEEASQRNMTDKSLINIRTNGNAISANILFDTSVAMGTVVLPLGFEQLPLNELGPDLINGMLVEVTQKNVF